MKKQAFIVLFTFLICAQQSLAQANLLNAKVPKEIGVQNEQQIEADNSSPIAYGYVDDRDILWSKTVWEIINLDERINFPYYYPTINNGYLSNSRQSLYRILIDNINSGNITEIYSTSYFNEKLTPEDLEDFVVGFSYTEGVISSATDIFDIDIKNNINGIEIAVNIDQENFQKLKQVKRNLF